MADLTAPIKAVLLYQARIHPSSPTNALREGHVAALIDTMQHVISAAVEADADYTRFPSHWLFHSRWDKVKSKS
jgi:formamidopyrimidine-DNA glycosylase